MASVGLKAAAGPPDDEFNAGRPGQAEDRLNAILRSQNFSAAIRPPRAQSAIIFAKRGECRLSVRDARGAESFKTVFAQDAATIGTVRYLYRGKAYDTLPGVRMRLGALETELQRLLGLSAAAPIPIALATSADCDRSDFGLGDVRI
jgi:hypothetical protein